MTFERFPCRIETSRSGKERSTMGMTDSQFKTFLRFLLNDLQEIRSEKSDEARNAKLEQIINTMQKALED